MRLGETVTGEGSHHLPDAPGDRLRHTAALGGSGDEALLQDLHLLAGVEVAHRPAQQVGLGQAEAGQLVGDAQHLLLVEDHAIGILQERLQGRVRVGSRFQAAVARHEGVLQTAGERAGTVERQGNHDIVDRAGVDLFEGGAHAGAFDLEAADGAAVLDRLGGERVIFRDAVQQLQAAVVDLTGEGAGRRRGPWRPAHLRQPPAPGRHRPARSGRGCRAGRS